MTQQQLATQSCISRDVIANIETGRYQNGPQAMQLKRLADALDHSIDWFFEDYD